MKDFNVEKIYYEKIKELKELLNLDENDAETFFLGGMKSVLNKHNKTDEFVSRKLSGENKNDK